MQRFVSIAALCLTIVPAAAQAPPTKAPPQVAPAPATPGQATTNCLPSRTTENGTITTPNANGTLGDRLAQADGVICPPAGVDPEIRAPTPNVGTTPVIPPPGSPGGDPSARPK